MFIDRIRERGWYGLVYNNTSVDVYYCPDLVKQFYEHLDPAIINLDQHHFIVHFDSGDLQIFVDFTHEVTQLPIPPHHATQLALINFMHLMGVR